MLRTNQKITKRDRVKRVIIFITVVILVGLIYGYIIIPMGFHIPCLFKLIYNISCPGCGLTRMCLSILHGNIIEALKYNIGLIMILPIIIYIVCKLIYNYINNSNEPLNKWLITSTLIYLILWMVIRNILNL